MTCVLLRQPWRWVTQPQPRGAYFTFTNKFSFDSSPFPISHQNPLINSIGSILLHRGQITNESSYAAYLGALSLSFQLVTMTVQTPILLLLPSFFPAPTSPSSLRQSCRLSHYFLFVFRSSLRLGPCTTAITANDGLTQLASFPPPSLLLPSPDLL